MEIRIGKTPPRIYELVESDAKKNRRTIAGQTLFIIQEYYAAQGVTGLDEKPPRKKRELKTTHDWPAVERR